MYNAAVLAMFKNESWIIQEWVEHYLNEGIDHFYLIDNGSDDDYLTKIQSYIDSRKITLVKDPFRQKTCTQDVLYNKHFLSTIKKETAWIIVVDMDEYIYARNGFNTISEYLLSVPKDISKIVLRWKLFGSNNVISHPSKIIPNFTKRQSEEAYIKYSNPNILGHSKTIARTSCLVRILTHDKSMREGKATYSDYKLFKQAEYESAKQFLHLNHYTLLSLQYYKEIKINRGGGQGAIYDLEKFSKQNRLLNEVEDIELATKYTKHHK